MSKVCNAHSKILRNSRLTIASRSATGSAIRRVAALHGRHTGAAIVTLVVHLLGISIACGRTSGPTAIAIVAITRCRGAAVTRRCEASATVVAAAVEM